MNLQPVTPSRAENNGTFKFAIERGASPFMELGRCVNVKRMTHGSTPGAPYVCRDAVRSDTGYADLDGAPFKAYFCTACAKELGVA
jgi:hypothetical protein